MAIYVDSANILWNGMIVSHLIADDLDELHAIATAIGLKKEWFQNKAYPHYDINLEKKKLAMKMGALEVTSKDIIKISKGESARIQLNLL